jgi:hypothetical protein
MGDTEDANRVIKFVLFFGREPRAPKRIARPMLS